MPERSPSEITRMLGRIDDGDESAAAELLSCVYDDLKEIANAIFRRQQEGQTLQPTALVHEAYLRLVRPTDGGYESRTHFFRVAARAMRQVLTDQARKRSSAKRGGGQPAVSVDSANAEGEQPIHAIDLVVLDEALRRLEDVSPLQARIVELRFLSGLSTDETAAALGIGSRSVKRHWAVARARLRRELEDQTQS